MRTIASTDLSVFPLCLGCNVFGWTIDEPQAFAVLDAYADTGGNFIDTADSYASWVDGNSGGESETIIGNWMAARGNRDELVLATKVGKMPGLDGLSPATLRRAAEDSLDRFGTDRIDLYYAHLDDESTPLEETLGVFAALIQEGKVRYIAASNYGAPRLAEALKASQANGLPSYVAIQPEYNLMHRGEYEGPLADLCATEGLSCVPYYALANGFLTGKYRGGNEHADSPRSSLARAYLDDRGLAVLAVLDELAANHETTVSAVALSWLAAQRTVVSPIASARTPEQLADLLAMAGLDLGETALRRLSDAASS